MKTILVAGGAGYIGSHVCKALAAAGFLPVAYDNLCHGHAWAVRWGPLETGDLADTDRLNACLDRYKPDAVIHLAGLIAAGESFVDPAKYYKNNVGEFLLLLDAMRRRGIDRMVFSSSAAVYGSTNRIPIGENQAIDPVNPYGQTKAVCERILADYGRAYGINSVSLRYFNAAGADPDGEIGEFHEPETHLIPCVLEAAAGLRPHIDLYGSDYPTHDGTCVRDYIHVSDLADAHVLALKRMTGSGETDVYNLGNGKGHSVREIIRKVEHLTNRRVPVRDQPRRPGDPPVLIADPRRSIRELGWHQRFADLDSQVTHAWRWLSRRKPWIEVSDRVEVAPIATAYSHGERSIG